MKTCNTLIVGASAAGLACAAQVKRRNIDCLILERESEVAGAWRRHYDRLHLHTNKSSSSLPFVPFAKEISKYPARLEVVTYMEKYCEELGINPIFNTNVTQIRRENSAWITTADKEVFQSKNIIICTGNTNIPRVYRKQGLESFPGKVMHSAEYKSGKEFKGKKVLVVGFGNSACEIAIDLHEQGVLPSMSVRSPVNVIPRDILGIPVLQIGIMQSSWPPRLADALNAPLVNLMIGNIERYGLKKHPKGPVQQIVEDHQIPLLDVGTMKLIREGEVRVFGDVEGINGSTIEFEDGSTDDFDAIVAAIGYDTGLENILDLTSERLSDLRNSITDQKYFGEDNVYFCGFYVSPAGMLREINIESGLIARSIQKDGE